MPPAPEPLTPFPVFDHYNSGYRLLNETIPAELFGLQPRDFSNPRCRLMQRCYRCGTETGLVYSNCTHDEFEYCKSCGGFTLHYTRPEN